MNKQLRRTCKAQRELLHTVKYQWFSTRQATDAELLTHLLMQSLMNQSRFNFLLRTES